jgi:hypothetical protein
MQLLKEHEYQTVHYEEEVQLRKRYEMKINELYILHRDVETRYKRAVEELIRVEIIRDRKSMEYDDKLE